MPTALGARSNALPLPTGVVGSRVGVDAAAPAWPPASYGIDPGGGNMCSVGTFQRPERFILKAGAMFIHQQPGASTRYDYSLDLVNLNVGYANDLNNIGSYQKANYCEGTTHDNPWLGACLEAMFYCEANIPWTVYLVSKGGGAGGYYYQSNGHYRLWAYSVGEGTV